MDRDELDQHLGRILPLSDVRGVRRHPPGPWGDEKMVLTVLEGRIRDACFCCAQSNVGGSDRSLSPPFGGGARGGVGSRLGNGAGPLGPRKIRLRTVSKHTANCPAHPPWPPLRKGGTTAPVRSTLTFHHPSLALPNTIRGFQQRGKVAPAGSGSWWAVQPAPAPAFSAMPPRSGPCPPWTEAWPRSRWRAFRRRRPPARSSRPPRLGCTAGRGC